VWPPSKYLPSDFIHIHLCNGWEQCWKSFPKSLFSTITFLYMYSSGSKWNPSLFQAMKNHMAQIRQVWWLFWYWYLFLIKHYFCGSAVWEGESVWSKILLPGQRFFFSLFSILKKKVGLWDHYTMCMSFPSSFLNDQLSLNFVWTLCHWGSPQPHNF